MNKRAERVPYQRRMEATREKKQGRGRREKGEKGIQKCGGGTESECTHHEREIRCRKEENTGRKQTATVISISPTKSENRKEITL